MKSRDTLAAVGVILAASLLLVIAPRGNEAPGSPARSADAAVGSPDAPGLRGLVRGVDGRGLAGAEIYLLPKTLGGDERVDVATSTDADGRWALPDVDPRGQWIGARADACVPAFADGDAWRGEAIVLAPPAGRRVVIHLEDERGEVPPGAEAVLTPPPRSGTFSYPAPGRRPSFSLTRSFDGVSPLSVRLPTEGPVMVVPSVPGHLVTPREVTLQPETAAASFRAARACTLSVHLLDADSGAPLAGPARILLLDLATGRTVIAADGVESFARDVTKRGIAPGHYTVLVDREGYQPIAGGDVRLAGPGAEAALEVRLAPDPATER